jgi:hypothetical protein
MKRWLFHFSITSRDQILSEIDETLRKAGVEETSTTGVQILADRFRKADTFARSYERRIFELRESVKEYERVFLAMKAQSEQADPIPPIDDQPTLIELAARRQSGIDLPMTQRTPIYQPVDTGPREMPVTDSGNSGD